MNHTAAGKERRRALFCFFLLTVIFFLLIYHGNTLSDAAASSLSFAAKRLVPSMFLFAVFAKIATRIPFFSSSRKIPLLHLPLSALPALLIGLFTGFPMGAYAAKNGFDEGILSEKEAHHLAAYANNASLGFLLFTVGALFSDQRVGLWLFLSGTLSSFFVGILFAVREKPSTRVQNTPPPPPFFSLFCDAVVSASQAMLVLSGYLTLFGVLAKALTMTPLPRALVTALLLVLEPTAAITHLATLPREIALPLSAFALGFSGFSIIAQSVTVWQNRLPLLPLVAKRTLIGLLSALFMLIFQKYL